MSDNEIIELFLHNLTQDELNSFKLTFFATKSLHYSIKEVLEVRGINNEKTTIKS